MGAGSSNAQATHVRIVDVLKRAPFMQMIDDKTINELAACFQLVRYGKGAVIKNDPWLFFIVAEGAVDISSLIPTSTRKQHLHEVLCQRKIGDYISFAAREQILGRLMEESILRAKAAGGGGVKPRVARKNLLAMLDLNHITADMFTGCTLLKLQRDRFLKLRARLESRQSSSRNQPINHTRRFSEGEAEPRKAGVAGGKPPPLLRRNTTMTGPEKISLLSSIIESDIVNYLFDIPFLEGVEQSRLVTLSNLCSYAFVRKGELLCEEGEIGDRFFICIRGSLQATVQAVVRHNSMAGVGGSPGVVRGNSKRVNQGERKLRALKKMGPGAYFGEISLLFRIPRICSIAALSDSLLVYIDRVAFCNFLKIVPDASLVLLEHVRLNFIDTLIKQGCAFLNAMPPLKRQELSVVSEIVEHDADDVLLEKGTRQSGFFIVMRGEVEVEYFPLQRAGKVPEIPLEDDAISIITPLTPNKEVIRVRPGGYFGHEAIILSEPSLVSVRCLDHCLVLRLTRDAFFDFFSSAPALYAEFCIKCLRDKSRPEHVMQHYSVHKLWGADCVNRRRQNELMLFESIEDFMWEADLAEENIHELALTVYMRFLTDNAPQYVRISPSTLDIIEDELSSQHVDRNVFASARTEILTRMEDENFEAFKQGHLFQDFLATLHCPQTIYDGLTTKHMVLLDMSQNERTRNGEAAARTTLELQDVEETAVPNYERRPKNASAGNNSGNKGGIAATSIGPAASQKRYLVTTDPFQQQAAGVASNGRRKSRIDASGLQRAPSSLVSTTFVL